MQYAYHNRGQMMQTGGGDKRALGSLGGTTLDGPTLPAAGAPEVMAMGNCGCGCKGAGTCGQGMGAITDLFQQSNWPYLAAAGVAAYFLLKKKRRRR